MQNNHIIDFLDLEDQDNEITDLRIEGNQKNITLKTNPSRHFCPICFSRMYSKGIKIRTVFHPILQDSYELVLKLRQRRWKCQNSICGGESITKRYPTQTTT